MQCRFPWIPSPIEGNLGAIEMKEIPLTKGYVALVDDADYDRVTAAGPWHAQVCEHTVYAQHKNCRGSRFARFIKHRKKKAIA
jgi:hypothetical protein